MDDVRLLFEAVGISDLPVSDKDLDPHLARNLHRMLDVACVAVDRDARVPLVERVAALIEDREYWLQHYIRTFKQVRELRGALHGEREAQELAAAE